MVQGSNLCILLSIICARTSIQLDGIINIIVKFRVDLSLSIWLGDQFGAPAEWFNVKMSVFRRAYIKLILKLSDLSLDVFIIEVRNKTQVNQNQFWISNHISWYFEVILDYSTWIQASTECNTLTNIMNHACTVSILNLGE